MAAVGKRSRSQGGVPIGVASIVVDACARRTCAESAAGRERMTDGLSWAGHEADRQRQDTIGATLLG